MAPEATGRTLSDEEVLRAVRWRFRICNYLFKLGAAWIVLGIIGLLFVDAFHTDATSSDIPFVVELIGFGIFSAAFVLTLAVYRCPVCDKYLSRFRPQKEYCPSCGAQVQAKS
jgi:hypothetical protein